MGLLGTRRRQQLWAAISSSAVVVLVGVDWLTREESGRSFMAPTAELLWVSVGLGAGLGASMLAATWLAPRRQREFAAEMARLPVRERLRWRHQRRNLLYHGWCVAGIWALAGCCLYRWVFILPAVYAMNAVLFAALPRWAIPTTGVGAETGRTGAAPDPAT